ncbi:sugar transferase [Streptomyces aculeolatus]
MRRIGVADTEIMTAEPRRGTRVRSAAAKPAWYLPAALVTDAAGIAIPVVLVFVTTRQPYPALCAALAAGGWLAVRAARRRYSARQLGESGAVVPLLQDWLLLFGVLAVVRAFTADSAAEPQPALLALLPGLVLTVVTAKLLHHHLVAARREGQAVRRVLVVAEPATADHVVGQLAARTDHEYVVVGVVPVGEAPLSCGAPEAARLGPVPSDRAGWDAQAVLSAAREHGAELVLAAPGPLLPASRLRQLAWAMHDAGLPLAVLPGIAEVAERRLRLSVVAGLTLLHIAPPLRRGAQSTLKAASDRVAAAVGIALLAPVFALIAAAVKFTSPGPVFHKQTRLGRGGAPFTMWKFRSMVEDAEQQKSALSVVNEHDGSPIFKIRRDPRVTRVGEALRRSSLDELPQLFNVLRGEMSLVGPRPPLPEEVARYSDTELRRLAVKPGMTGLWQVSGRSDLTWDETIALDLHYVENWSFAHDMDVMARTLRAVVDGRGAY